MSNVEMQRKYIHSCVAVAQEMDLEPEDFIKANVAMTKTDFEMMAKDFDEYLMSIDLLVKYLKDPSDLAKFADEIEKDNG